MAEKILAAPCGLYCGLCDSYLEGLCHGCGCEKQDCKAEWHHKHCIIFECLKKRKLSGCHECKDFPCTSIIQFTFDPVWKTHLMCIENLQRRKKIRTEAWIKEQKTFWGKNKKLRDKWIKLKKECREKSIKK